MTKVPFIVVCTSCESVLEVRNPELVGQIVACPKCGSMVLIEQTSQLRHLPPVSQTADAALSENLPDSLLTSQTSDASLSQNITFSEHFIAIPQGELADEDINETYDEIADETSSEERLGGVASELQTKFLSNKSFNIWQKRRLIIVVAGTVCLLVFFIAFLLFKPQPHDVVSTEMNPAHAEKRNNLPQVPTGIEVTRTGGLPDNQPPDTPSTQEGKQNSTMLPPPEDIRVEGQSETKVVPADNNDDQNTNITDSSAESTQTEPSPNPDRQGITVHVPISPAELTSDDPFGDLFDNINIDNVNINSEENNGLNITPGKQPIILDGFAPFIEEDTVSTDPKEQDTVSDASLPDNFEASEEKEDGAGYEVADDKEIDVNELLAVKVAAIHFDKAPIVDVVRAISDLSGIPMQLDVDELRVRTRNIGIEAPVSLQLQDTTIAEIIEAVLQKTQLTRYEDDGWLTFGYTDEQKYALRTARYDMSRLASLEQNPISAKQAADWISELLVSQTQNPKTLNATVAVDGNEIVVVGTIWLQDQAKRLLQSLYYLRDLEPENGMSPERLAPEVFGWDRVDAPLSYNLVAPIPLKQAVRQIEDHTKLRILIDHAALRGEKLSQESLVTSRVSDGTIDTVLRRMLESLGLTYRIVEANAVEITTPQVAEQKMTIEPHLFTPLADGQTPESCAEALQQKFAGGTIVIDQISGYMLVRQSQPLQRDIRLWFGSLHTELENKEKPEGSVSTMTGLNRVSAQ